MNIYLLNANTTNFYFPQNYNGSLLQSMWDFSQPAKVFDLLEDEYQENSLFIIDYINFLVDFPYCNDSTIRTDRILKFQKIKNKKIIIDASHKTFLSKKSQNVLKIEIKMFLQMANFFPENIYYIVQTKKDIEIVKECLEMNINIFNKDKWQHELYQFSIQQIFQNKENYITITKNLPKKKFSIFIRRYEDIRLHVYCELIAKNLLDSFYYTFCSEIVGKEYDSNSYNDIINYINSLPEYFNPHKEKILDWIKNIPYTAETNLTNFYDSFYSTSIGPYFNSSDINLVVESHVEEITDKDLTCSLTEKTYKAILYKKLFIIFSQPYNLQYLRDCGYKTFAPYIDESYDTILNTKERIRAIATEIEKINNLPINEYQNLINNCQNIVEHNYNLMIEEINKPIPDNFLLKNINFL